MADDIRQRIEDNIYAEAVAHIKSNGRVKIGERGPEWKPVMEQAMLEAKRAYEEGRIKLDKVVRTREQKVEDKERRRAKRAGMSYEEWADEAKKFYSVNLETYEVTSVARSPNTPPQVWYCFDAVEAREKVLELLDYKYVDHFLKGHDFAYKIEEDKT